MSNRRKHINFKLYRGMIRTSFVMVFILCTFGLIPVGQADDGALAIVSNSKGVPTEMSSSEMKTVFKGERQRWKDGTKVVIALMKTTTSSGGSTAQKIYKMSGQEMNKYWLALVFQGKAKAPKFFTSESALKEYVAETPGAIGVIGLASLGDGKSVLIDGSKSF